MWNNWVGRRIQASNRNLLFWGLALCAAAVGLLLLMHAAVENYRHGPFPLDDRALLAAEDPADQDHFYVTYENKLHSKPFFVEKSGKTNQALAEYLLAPVRDRGLLIRAPVNHQGDTFTGQLRALSPQEKEKILPALKREGVGVLPCVLDLTIAFQAGVLWRLALLGLLFAAGLWLGLQAVRRMRAPQLHPLARALRRHGPPDEVADTIEASAVAGRVLRVGPVDFLGSWLVCRLRGVYKVFRLDDVVWAHKLVVRVNGVPNFYAKLFDRHGEFFQVLSSEKRIDGILTAIAAISPWLIAGYDPKLEALWKQNPKALIEAVEERRRQYLASRQPPESPDQPPR